MQRRDFMAAGAALASGSGLAAQGQPPAKAFPRGFIWGVATAGHQIEGNNVNSDFWLLENVRPTVFKEPSGDACNSLALWQQDLDLVKSLGLNSYRFSIEWSRIEPEKGVFSIAMLDFYKAQIEGCRARGLAPMVTFNHWSVPRWFAAQGGWTNPESVQLFGRYCDRAARHLGQHIAMAATLNEANGLLIAQRLVPTQAVLAQRPMLAAAAKAMGSERFVGGPSIEFAEQITPQLLAAHRVGRQAIQAAWPKLPVGMTMAVLDDVAEGEGSVRDAMRQRFYGAWCEAVRGDDFVGVQNYTRVRWGAEGPLPPGPNSVLNDDGSEVHPDTLAQAVRYIHQATGRPILVTEHGAVAADDRARVALIPAALRGLRQAMDEGVPVLGYYHWTLMDNFEWHSGYAPKLGLATVDRVSFKRTLKPSAQVLARIARANAA